jgi:hypothetical protein
VSLLDADPDLGSGLTETDLAVARRYARAAVESVPAGVWDPDRMNVPGSLGLLVLDGMMIREIEVGGRRRAELLGPGDILRPWDREPATTLPLAHSFSWSTPSGVELAVLDVRLTPLLTRWPAMLDELLRRNVVRAHRLGLQLAIGELQGVDVRLEAMLWHIAERWGRVTLAGVVVPFCLTHETLGRVVGARRPSVTTALTALNERGAVRRLPDGTWLLAQPATAPL